MLGLGVAEIIGWAEGKGQDKHLKRHLGIKFGAG